jgi:hypothetical protein
MAERGEVLAQVSACSCRYCDCFMVITYGVIERLAGVDVLGLADAMPVELGSWSQRASAARLPDRLFTLDRSLMHGGPRRPRSGGVG